MAATTAATQAPNSASQLIDPGDQETLNWILGWTVVGGITMLAMRSKIGYSLVYYCLLLMLVFLILTQYKWIAKEIGDATGQIPLIDQPATASTLSYTSFTPSAHYGAAGIIPL